MAKLGIQAGAAILRSRRSNPLTSQVLDSSPSHLIALSSRVSILDATAMHPVPDSKPVTPQHLARPRSLHPAWSKVNALYNALYIEPDAAAGAPERPGAKTSKEGQDVKEDANWLYSCSGLCSVCFLFSTIRC
ncbi:hypothetical protein CCM_01443 [Cordyceps militaris CM01]|uniref:Uncharacterized protein n=1 Tax=Cordyceps militaris (strain CM01) TaxID=983644 RepID=G3J522_CORMM|nr:uncharacterized protein CCM_01443 [Cordyceps militaris CM01]EGX96785.1 hypothetical protein CCM_01443 [Cordyceps militaris CM01]